MMFIAPELVTNEVTCLRLVVLVSSEGTRAWATCLQVSSQFEAVYLVPFSNSGGLYSAVFLKEETVSAMVRVSLHVIDCDHR